MKYWITILILSIITVSLTTLINPPSDLPPDLILASSIGSVLGLITMASVLGGIFYLFSRSMKSFFTGWLLAYLILSSGSLYEAFYTSNGTEKVGNETFVSDSNSYSNPRATDSMDKADQNMSFTLSDLEDNPTIFISHEYNFGIAFPGGNPNEIKGEFVEGTGSRFQFINDSTENVIIYSVTVINGKPIPKTVSTKDILNSTVDIYLELDSITEYENTKEFKNWGKRLVLFYDSVYPFGEIEIPKRTMILMDRQNAILYNLSVISDNRSILKKSLDDFASTFVLIE